MLLCEAAFASFPLLDFLSCLFCAELSVVYGVIQVLTGDLYRCALSTRSTPAAGSVSAALSTRSCPAPPARTIPAGTRAPLVLAMSGA